MRECRDKRLKKAEQFLLNALARATEQERLYVGEDNNEELEHLQARAACLAEILNSLKCRQNDLDTIELDANLFALWDDLHKLRQHVPKGLKVLQAIRALYRKVKPENDWVHQLTHLQRYELELTARSLRLAAAVSRWHVHVIVLLLT